MDSVGGQAKWEHDAGISRSRWWCRGRWRFPTPSTSWCSSGSPRLGCPAFSGLLNLRSLCGELRIQVFGADFAWCPVAECGVNSPLIVEQFDVAGNVLL